MGTWMRRLRRSVVPVCALFALAGCDGDPADPPADDPFDPAFAAQTLTDIDAVLETTQLQATVGLITFTLAWAGDGGGSAALGSLPPAAPSLAPAVRGLTVGAMPAQYLGRTLVYDEPGRAYIVDPARAGAPVDGVRFIAYDMNLDTNSPALPLDEVGYVDLEILEEDGTSLILSLTFIATDGPAPVTTADYTIRLEGGDAVGADVLFDAAGHFGTVPNRVDFEVALHFDFPVAGGIGRFTQEVAFDRGAGRTLRESLVTDFNTATFQSVGDADYLSTITHGPDRLVLDLAIGENDDLAGTVAWNDAVVLLVSGNYASPSFRLGGGDASGHAAAMTSLWRAIHRLSDTGRVLLGPADAIASF